jgi:hypothetical protein
MGIIHFATALSSQEREILRRPSPDLGNPIIGKIYRFFQLRASRDVCGEIQTLNSPIV